MQAGFLRLFALRERDEKEELPLKFSLRILLLNPRMLSCSLNLLQCQFDAAASIAALLRCVKNAGWVVGEQNFLHTQERGKQHVSPEVHFALTDWGSVSLALRWVQSPWRFELRKAPKEAVDPGFVSFSPFQEACPDLFLSRALPAAGCDSKLSLGSGMQSSELSRQSLAYPCPTEINLARPVRNRGCPGPARIRSHASYGNGAATSEFRSPIRSQE